MITKEHIRDFLENIRNSKEYEYGPCKAIVDAHAEKLMKIVEKIDTDEYALKKIENIVEAIALAVNVAQKAKFFEPGAQNHIAKPVKTPKKKPVTQNIDNFLSTVPPESRQLFQKLANSYGLMVDTLIDYGYQTKIPIMIPVLTKIRQLGPEMLSCINRFNKPVILLVPPGNFFSKVDKIDHNPKYEWQNFSQGITGFSHDPRCDVWGPKKESIEVYVVDGSPCMPPIPAKMKKNKKLPELYALIKNSYLSQGMAMISDHEYAMLVQMSLRLYERAKTAPDQEPEEMIIDKVHCTLLCNEHLSDTAVTPGNGKGNAEDFAEEWTDLSGKISIPYAGWDSINNCFIFYINQNPAAETRDYVSRPSIRVW